MVTVGMSQSQVRRLWGEPRDIIAAEDQSGQEIWTYEFKKAVSRSVSRTVYTLTFAEGKLTEVAEKMF
jgi:outer membrane protein assembly factor BamE (lipoprotein component of BamABCDE complex)